MAVVANVNTDLGKAQVKYRKTEVARAEIEFLPKAGGDMGNMSLAVLAQIGAIVVNHRGSVVVNPLLPTFVDGDDQRQMMASGLLLHQANGGTVGNGLRKVIPLGGLFRTEIRTVKDFLQTYDLRSSVRRLANKAQMLFNHGLFSGLERGFRGRRVGSLNQRTTDVARHVSSRNSQRLLNGKAPARANW